MMTSNPTDSQTTLSTWDQPASTNQETTQQPNTTPPTINRNDLPTEPHPLGKDTKQALHTDNPAPPLEDTITTLATRDPTPTTTPEHQARALYIYWRAGIHALPGYTLDNSMIDLRDCIDAELNVATTTLVDEEFLQDKQINGRWKYYRLTTQGRQRLQATHPEINLLKANQKLPVVSDGPIHNRGAQLAARWLRHDTDCTHVQQPALRSSTPIDLAGIHDGDRRWVGEVVAAEDIGTDTLLTRIQYLEAQPEQSLLVFETSPVATRAIAQLDTAGILDIPPTIDYRQYSIAQLREHILPEIEHGPVDHIESVATLMEEQ